MHEIIGKNIVEHFNSAERQSVILLFISYSAEGYYFYNKISKCDTDQERMKKYRIRRINIIKLK